MTKTLTLIFVLFFILPVYLTASNNIKEGDHAFIAMNYDRAIQYYLIDSSNSEAQWRAARAYICLADISTGEKRQKLISFAEKSARRSIQLNNLNANGHSWLAIALGNKAMYEGSRSKVALCNEIKKELDIALQLNPRDDLSYSVLGTFYRALGKISWFERTLAKAFLGGVPAGGFKESEAALKKAILYSPETIRHWYELALLYQDWGNEDQKVKAYKKVCALKIQVASDVNRLKASREAINNI